MERESRKDVKIDRWHQKRRAFSNQQDRAGQRLSRGLEI